MGATFGRIESKGKFMPMYVHTISVRSHIFMAWKGPKIPSRMREIIRFSWWINDMIYHFTKRLTLVENYWVRNFFKQKLITDSATLNKWESFSGMVDKWRDPLEDYIFSPRMAFYFQSIPN